MLNTHTVISRVSTPFKNWHLSSLVASFYTVFTCIYLYPEACLESLSLREHWMRLLNPFISHKRLSEIYIPGSHDAAAYDCLRESGVVFSDISTIQVFYGRINNDAVSIV